MPSGNFGDGMRNNAARWASLSAASRNKNTLSLAQQILSASSVAGAQGGKGANSAAADAANQESPFGRLIDLLTTPLAAVAGGVGGLAGSIRDAQSGSDFNLLTDTLGGAAKSATGNLYSFATADPNIEGKGSNSFLKVLQDIQDSSMAQSHGLKANQLDEYRNQYDSEMSPVFRMAGFAGDVLGDPLTYVGGLGLGRKTIQEGVKVAEAATKAGEVTSDVSKVARPHGWQPRQAITATPESILDNGQMVLPGTNVPKVNAPAAREFGNEIPRGDYAFPQATLPGMESDSKLLGLNPGIEASGQRTLFGKDAVSKSSFKPAERGYEASGEIPKNVQGDANSMGLLFTKSGNPYKAWLPEAVDKTAVAADKAQEVVTPVAKVDKVAADVAEALAPVAEKAGVSAEKIVQTLDAAKAEALKKVNVFEDAVVTPAKQMPIAESGNVGKQINQAVGRRLTQLLGKMDVTPETKILAESGAADKPTVSNISVVALGKAMASGNVGALKGLRFSDADGKVFTAEQLVKDAQVEIKQIRSAGGATQKSSTAAGTPVASPVTSQKVSAAWKTLAKEAGFTDAQISSILKSKDTQKAIDKIVTASKAKESSTVKSAVDAGVDPAGSVARTSPDVIKETPTPIPSEQIAQGVEKAQQQAKIASTAMEELAGQHPSLAVKVIDIVENRVSKIKADPRSAPTPEEAAKQLETLGITHSVPNPKGVVRANPHHQRQMFSDILLPAGNRFAKKGSKVSETITQRAELAYKALQAAEEHLKTLGAPPMMFVGSNGAFRLSEFLSATARDIDTTVEDLIIRLGWIPYGPGVKPADKALEEMVTTALTQGRNAGFDLMGTQFPSVKALVEDGVKVQAAIDATSIPKIQAEASDLLAMADRANGNVLATDAADLKTAVHDVPVVVNEITAQAGASQAAADHVIAEMQKGILGTPDNAAPAAVDSVATTSSRKAAKGDRTVNQHNPVAEAIDNEAGATTQAARIANTENRWMSRLNAWYGYKDLYPYHVQQVQGAGALTHLLFHVYGETINKLHLTPEVLGNAWKAIGSKNVPLTEQEKVAVQFIEQRMGNALRDVNVPISYNNGTSVVTRSGITMDELNHELALTGLDFSFSAAEKGKPAAQWMDSWRTYEGKYDPMEFAFKVETAVNRAATKKSLWSDLHYNFHDPSGVALDPKLYPELAGSRFPREIADQIPTLFGKIDEVFSPGGEFGKAIDTFLASWKTGVTIYMPSHHIRNVIGDLFFAYLAGVRIGDPRLIAKMTKVMRAQRSFYKDAKPEASVFDMISAMRQGNLAESNILTKTPEPADIVSKFTSKKGKAVEISAQDMWTAAFERGIIKHSMLIEDIPTESLMEKIGTKYPSMKRIVSPTGGRIQRGARGVSETREHGVRLLHFIDATERNVKKNLARGMEPERALRLAFDDAAARVQKWHPDGTGMTDWERKYMRRIFPFYSWTRKAIPLLGESLLTNPAKLTLYPKFMHDVMGVEGQQDLANPWPLDQAFPRWLREMPIGPVAGGSAGNYTVFNPSNPFTDLGNQFINDPKGGIASMVNPLARIPAEIMTGTDAQTGAPIQDWGQYADKQIPLLSVANRVGNTSVGFGSVSSLANGGSAIPYNNTGRATNDYVNNNALWNLLTAAGLINASQPNYMKQAEYEARDRKIQENKKIREAANNQ